MPAFPTRGFQTREREAEAGLRLAAEVVALERAEAEEARPEEGLAVASRPEAADPRSPAEESAEESVEAEVRRFPFRLAAVAAPSNR